MVAIDLGESRGAARAADHVSSIGKRSRGPVDGALDKIAPDVKEDLATAKVMGGLGRFLEKACENDGGRGGDFLERLRGAWRGASWLIGRFRVRIFVVYE